METLYKVFCLKDSKSASYGGPMLFENHGMAIRWIQEGLQNGQPVWAKHPQDFSLFEIGEYDPRSGTMVPGSEKNCIGLVQDFKISLDLN